MIDPPDAFPDYTGEIANRIEKNWKRLRRKGVKGTRCRCDLLATEDELVGLVRHWEEGLSTESVMVDISSFPKRYFCFILKRLLANPIIQNFVVTYTEAGSRGYSGDHLCDDPLPCDYLPGYTAPVPPASEWLVVSVGFETLNISSLVSLYRESAKRVKFLVTFPPGLHTNQRQWDTLFEVAEATGVEHLTVGDIETVSLWDAERVYRRLEQWKDERQAIHSARGTGRTGNGASAISLAPFGPKPHSLAMALFAMKYRCGMYYTQPKSYNPDYSLGAGTSWYYVVKWKGVSCLDR